MDVLLQFTKTTVMALFGIMDVLLLLRALLSWFMMQENRFIDFIFSVTEPMIMPFRLLFHRLGWFQDSFIDVPFLVTIMVIAILETVVEVL